MLDIINSLKQNKGLFFYDDGGVEFNIVTTYHVILTYTLVRAEDFI